VSAAFSASSDEPHARARKGLAGAVRLAAPGSPADCGKLIVEEIEKWAKVVRAGNIKPE
jgi:hypothetical protein